MLVELQTKNQPANFRGPTRLEYSVRYKAMFSKKQEKVPALNRE